MCITIYIKYICILYMQYIYLLPGISIYILHILRIHCINLYCMYCILMGLKNLTRTILYSGIWREEASPPPPPVRRGFTRRANIPTKHTHTHLSRQICIKDHAISYKPYYKVKPYKNYKKIKYMSVDCCDTDFMLFYKIIIY